MKWPTCPAANHKKFSSPLEFPSPIPASTAGGTNANPTAILILLMANGICNTLPAKSAAKDRVDIYMSGHDESAALLGPSRILVSGIFDQIGIRLVWHTGELTTVNSTPAAHVFAIRTCEHALESATPDALASARIVGASGTEIAIYKDRLNRLIAGHANIAKVASAYVLAHELAHVMQGVARHSESGILKAHWGEEDYQEMVFHKLLFTSNDVDLIHRGLNPVEPISFDAPQK